MLKKIFALSGFKIALMVTFLVSFLFLFGTVMSDPSGFLNPVLNLPDKKWIDIIVGSRETQPHSSEVVIATIDTLSVDKYGRWPWPRSRMAEMITALNDHYEVGVIGLDIVFSEPEQAGALEATEDIKKEFSKLKFPDSGSKARFNRILDEKKIALDGDAQFGRALKKGNNSILGYFFFSDPEKVKHMTEAEIESANSRIAGSEISLVKGTIADGIIPKGFVPEPNIKKIFDGGVLSGFFNMSPDPEDGTVRRVHLLIAYGERTYPSLDLQLIRFYLGAQNIIVEAGADGTITGVEVGNKFIRTNFDGSVLLNYKGPQETFPHYSIYDIIERNIPKEKLEGKIVLVGATEVGIFDLRTTPVGVAYPGVEVHATLMDNLLTDTYFQLSDANHGATVLLILIFGLILAFTVPNLNGVWAIFLTVGLLIAYIVAHYFMVTVLLTWTSIFYPSLTILLIWAAVTLYRFLVTDKDKRFIRSAFQQYLSPEVITQLMDNPKMLKLGGERRELTAFFSDVQGFSTISEQLTPDELVNLLNTYLTEMSDIIMEQQGTVDKYEGDAIIAFFGAPVLYDDHAIRACLVTLAMQKRLAEMREEWKKDGSPQLLQRIGLNTGPMVVGNMGSINRFDYTMMGNSVNLAARLEGANKNYGTFSMVSEMTYEPAKDVVEARELDLIRVVGINTPVRVYELLAKKGEMDEQTTKGVAYFKKGLELYRDQQWDEAVKYFNAVYKFIPEDPPSSRLIDRCTAFKASPPGKEWDGVFTATEK